MPMEKPEDFGGGQEDNRYCVNCCNPEGSLKSREEVRQGMAQFMMTEMGQQITGEKVDSLDQALEKADSYMSQMPAWKE